jgi:signal transduction histidine kinase
MFGYNEQEFEKLSLPQLVNTDQREFIKKFMSFDIRKDQIRNTEIECLRKDNSAFLVEIFLNYVVSENQIYAVVHDITEKKQIQKKNIVKAIIETEEKERAHFSKELHDGIGPLLSTIKLYLQWSERPNSNISRKEIIQKAEEILEEALTTVKEISYKLSPHLLTNYGLTSAVQNFSRKLEETNTISIDFQSNLTRRIEIEVEIALYRAIIECVNNTIKYAKAAHIYIIINDKGKEILLNYKDDGVGFDIEEAKFIKKGMGLFNLQNRIETIGGRIKMSSKPQKGVDYHIIVPINNLIIN